MLQQFHIVALHSIFTSRCTFQIHDVLSPAVLPPLNRMSIEDTAMRSPRILCSKILGEYAVNDGFLLGRRNVVASLRSSLSGATKTLSFSPQISPYATEASDEFFPEPLSSLRNGSSCSTETEDVGCSKAWISLRHRSNDCTYRYVCRRLLQTE